MAKKQNETTSGGLVDLEKILTDQELRRIFGYENHDEINAVTSLIKEYIEKTLNCRISFATVSGTQQKIKAQFFAASDSERGVAKRTLINIVNQLRAAAKNRKPSQNDLNGLAAALGEKWSRNLKLGKNQHVKILLGRSHRSSDKIFAARDKRDISASIIGGEVLSSLTDAQSREIQSDVFLALEKLRQEKLRAPMTMEDALPIIQPESGTMPVVQITARAQAPKSSDHYLIYVPLPLIGELDEAGNPPEEMREYFQAVAQRFAVDIHGVFAKNFRPPMAPAANDDLPSTIAELEAEAKAQETEAKKKTPEGKQARALVRRIGKKIAALQQYEKALTLPPVNPVVLGSAAQEGVIHRRTMEGPLPEGRYFTAFRVSNRVEPGQKNIATNADYAIKVLDEVIARWANFRREQAEYPGKLERFDLPAKTREYEKKYDQALNKPIINHFMGATTADAERLKKIRTAFLAAMTAFAAKNGEKLDKEMQAERKNAIAVALRKADKTILENASIILAANLIDANARFLETTTHPANNRPKPPEDTIPALLALRLKTVSQPHSPANQPILTPRQTKKVVDPQKAAAALTKRASKLARRQQEIEAAAQNFIGGRHPIIPAHSKAIFELVLGGKNGDKTPPNIALINSELQINLILPSPMLGDTYAIKIPDSADDKIAQQAQLLLGTLIQRARERLPNADSVSPPITVQEIIETLAEIRVGMVNRGSSSTATEFSLAAVELGDAHGYVTRPLAKNIAAAFNDRLLDSMRSVFNTDFALVGKGDTLGYVPNGHSLVIGHVIERIIQQLTAYNQRVITPAEIRNLAGEARQMIEITEQKTFTGSGKKIKNSFIACDNQMVIDYIALQTCAEDSSWTPRADLYFSPHDNKTFDSLKPGPIGALIKNETGAAMNFSNRRLTISGKEENLRRAIDIVLRYISIMSDGYVMPDSRLQWRERAIKVAIAEANGEATPSRDSLLDEHGREPGKAGSTGPIVMPMNRDLAPLFNSWQKDLLADMHATENGLPVYQFILIPGPAGTGKTSTALFGAMELVNDTSTPYRKIVFIAPNSSVDGSVVGTLPGNKWEKTRGQYHMFVQHLYKHFGDNGNGVIDKERAEQKILHYMNKGVLEFVLPSEMRGLNIENAIVLFDEAENVANNVVKTAISRIHKTSMIVFMGDPAQCDLAARVARMQRDLKHGDADVIHNYAERILNVPDHISIDDKDRLIIRGYDGKEMIFPNAHEQAKWDCDKRSNEIRSVVPYNSMTWLALAMPPHIVKVADFTDAPRVRNPRLEIMDQWFNELKEPQQGSAHHDGRTYHGTKKLPARPAPKLASIDGKPVHKIPAA